MSDANVEIKLTTTADPAGVKQMSEAITGAAEQTGDLAQKADEAAEAISHASTATEDMSRGAQQARNDYDDLFNDLKKGIADTLQAGGADKKFIGHVVDEFDRLNASLKEAGASGDEVAQKIAALQQKLMEDAAAEERRIQQLKVNFQVALEEKQMEEEAAALKRRRREEDQLYMEQEGKRLKEQTELLEQQIMARLKQERLAREAIGTTQEMGQAMQGTKRSIGDAALTAAYFVDDLQYGIKGVVNNIPQLAMAFGAGAGLTGVVSIAAVAVSLLWEKFGGAKEAQQDAEALKTSLEDMHDAMKRSSEAAQELVATDLARYASDVERATTAWRSIKAEVGDIVSYHKELANVQREIATSQLEVARQTALAGATSAEDKKSINAHFDARKSALQSRSAVEGAAFDLEAAKAQDELLRRQAGNVARQKAGAEGRIGDSDRATKDFVGSYGDRSDQGIHVREAEALQKKLMELQQRLQEMETENREQPVFSEEQAAARDAAIRRVREQIDETALKRDRSQVGLAADKEALATGKGLKFDKLTAEAEKKSKEGDDGTKKLLDLALEKQKQINDEREAAEKALDKATKELTELRKAQAESERQLVLKKKQLEAAELKDSESFAKSGAAAAQAKQEADERAVKLQAEERRRKLENDAAEAEARGDYVGAAKKRNEAGRMKLPDDATPEQQRAQQIEASERMEAARKKQQQGRPEPVVDAGNIIGPLANLAGNLGAAGSGLSAAVAKLKDGATEKELQNVVALVQQLGPLINQRFGSQDQRFSQLEKAVSNLTSQLRNYKMSQA